MIPGSFEYLSPTSLEEAVALLGQHGDEAKILSGGQSLIPAMRFRLAQPGIVIDINGIPNLEYIREEGDRLLIGGLTRESALEASPIVNERYPLLADTARVIADPLVRNMATVGGNLAHADPANDHPATMLAYGAEIVAHGPEGDRTLPIDEFFTGLFESALRADEILTEVRIPAPVAGSGGAYVKIERKVGDYAISAVAVQLRMDGDTVTEARIGLTNVSPSPMRAIDAEQALSGSQATESDLEAAGQAAAAACDPSGDLRGPEEYKRDLTRILTKRAIVKAIERSKGGQK